MSSSHRLALMTEYKPEAKRKKTSAAEYHQGEGCKYIKRSEMRNINGQDRRLHYWVRSCDCGVETDHSDMLEVDSENWNKTNGIEVHLKEDCHWSQPEICK